MVELQAWFAPLLWIIGTITALVAFVRLCKPVWAVFQCPKKMDSTLVILTDKMDKHYAQSNKNQEEMNQRLSQIEAKQDKADEVQMSLLHDAIAQIYTVSQLKGEISEADYKRACDLNDQNGESDYIDSLMLAMKEMYISQQKHKIK